VNGVLWILAIAAPAAVLAAGRVPILGIAGTFLALVATLSWAVHRGVRAWSLAMVPGAAAVIAFASGEVGPYLGAVLAGPIVARALATGRAPRMALALGVAPLAAWAVMVALSGFDPFEASSTGGFDRVVDEAYQAGKLTTEQVADWQTSSRIAQRVLRRTWVATEVVSFWLTLVAAYMVARRLLPGFRAFGRFSRLRLPDVAAWVLITGLALVFLGQTAGPDAAKTVGWNLVFATGFAFFLCGVAIAWDWMDRAGFRRLTKVAVMVGGAIFFLPMFLATTSGLGLFDTWFDFRRLRAGEPGHRPFSPFSRSSDDDRQER
jgi:hypothetical protein